MSHFAVLVIGENPEAQLAPFDENIVMDRYVKLTREQAIAKERANIESYRENTYSVYLADPEAYAEKWPHVEHLEYLKNEFPKRLSWSDEEVYQEAIKYEDSENIGPEGEVYSTYNPNSKWDYFRLGGRYCARLKIKEGVDYLPIKLSYEWKYATPEQIAETQGRKADTARKGDIENIDELSAFAVLKDGEWYERGKMGWWGIVHDEKDEDEWKKQFATMLESLPDDTLISYFDCHI
jgi:hypothetical protein